MCLLSYLKNHIVWLSAAAFSEVMMALVMFLNHVPVLEIAYGILVSLFLFVCVVGGGFWRYWKRYIYLRRAGSYATVSLEKLPETKDPVETEYRAMLDAFQDEKLKLQNEGLKRERDLMEYYTMWVHQIKTPIAALKLLLQESDRGTGERGEELQELFSIEQYVEMALQYMRLGSETTDYVLRRIPLDDLVREAVRKYARQFIGKKLALHYEAAEAVVLTDEKWLEFVIEQLLSNALKYTDRGSISIYTEDGRLVISDTGIGIRSEDLPRVCEKGYTGYNGHADKRSTGIGLYLCSRILKKLGHSFEITSVEGQGTRAVIGFPEAEEP